MAAPCGEHQVIMRAVRFRFRFQGAGDTDGEHLACKVSLHPDHGSAAALFMSTWPRCMSRTE